MLQETLHNIAERMAQACSRSGRDVAAVSLLPVTKRVEPDRIEEAVTCGLRVFGESRVQEAKQKIAMLSGSLEWHFIGHLQTNKVRDAAALFRMIHSVDSWRLIESLDAACGAQGVAIKVCLEVNVSGEASKFGLSPETVPEVVKNAGQLPRVDVVGLMTIPPYSKDPEDARPFFRRLRELRDRLRGETGVPLPDLSMGMSHDFEVAIEEGATWVRLGAALFGERKGAGHG
jgi:PLP dependent protein